MDWWATALLTSENKAVFTLLASPTKTKACLGMRSKIFGSTPSIRRRAPTNPQNDKNHPKNSCRIWSAVARLNTTSGWWKGIHLYSCPAVGGPESLEDNVLRCDIASCSSQTLLPLNPWLPKTPNPTSHQYHHSHWCKGHGKSRGVSHTHMASLPLRKTTWQLAWMLSNTATQHAAYQLQTAWFWHNVLKSPL